jgi:phosphoglycolate phosphatase-like HAD superfamily hydrolase
LLVALARRRSRQTAEPEQRVGMTRLPDEAVLLDFDDTLSGPSHRAIGCVSFALQSLDLPLASAGRIRGTIGLSPTGTLTHPGGDDAAALDQGSCRQSVQRAGEVVTDVARLFQSAPPAMAAPREEGRGLETASAGSSHRIQSLLDREGLPVFFEAVVAGQDVLDDKGDLEGLRLRVPRVDRPLTPGEERARCRSADQAARK